MTAPVHSQSDLLTLAASLERGEHPLAAAIVAGAEERKLTHQLTRAAPQNVPATVYARPTMSPRQPTGYAETLGKSAIRRGVPA